MPETVIGTTASPLSALHLIAGVRRAGGPAEPTGLNGPVRITTDPDEAAAALVAGHLAALPTETVYGLGARADLPHAIARVYAAKGRPAVPHSATARRRM